MFTSLSIYCFIELQNFLSDFISFKKRTKINSKSTILKDVMYFPKGFFPSGNFPCVFSQVETSELCNFPSLCYSMFQSQRSAPQPILAAALDPHCSILRLRRPNLNLFGNHGKLPLGKLSLWKSNAFEKIPNTGSYLVQLNGSTPFFKIFYRYSFFHFVFSKSLFIKTGPPPFRTKILLSLMSLPIPGL